MDDQSKTHETGYYPKSMDELRFYLKHLVKKYKLSQPTEDDAVFNATNVQYAGRKKERHGYEAADKPGNDREVYEGEDHMNEGEVVSMKHGHKKGDLVTHEGKGPYRVLDVIPPGTKQMNHKGETVVTKHAVVRLDRSTRGKPAYPKDVPAHKVSPWTHKEEVEGKRLTDILEVESLDEIFGKKD